MDTTTIDISNRSGKSNCKLTGRLSDLMFSIINYTFLSVFFMLVLYPLIYVISASVSNPSMVASGKMFLWPVGFTLEGYQYVFQYQDIWLGYANTIFYTVFGTAVNLIVTLPCAYALSRKDFYGRNIIMTLFIITMYFSGGLIPIYLNYHSFNLINRRTILLIHGAVSTYNLIVCRTFFATTVPWELQEAARIDGCSDLRTFIRIVLPLSMPIIVVMTLYYGVGHWNNYFTAMIFLQNRNLYPLQLFLREILVQSKIASDALEMADPDELSVLMKQAEVANLLKYAVIVVSTAPMMILYPMLQKFFAKGVMIGAIKG